MCTILFLPKYNSHLGNHFSPIIHIFITLPTTIQRLWPRLLLLLLLLQLRMMHRLRRTRYWLSPHRLSISGRRRMLHPLHSHTLLLLLR